jgi:hypothetical protein
MTTKEQDLLFALESAARAISNHYDREAQYQHEAWSKRLRGSIDNAIKERINPNRDIINNHRKFWKLEKRNEQTRNTDGTDPQTEPARSSQARTQEAGSYK